MTKGEIDRLGEKIRLEGSNISENTLLKLQEYRISHKETLASVFNILCNLNRKISRENIVTYRIKRFESIIGKLNHYPEMRFNRMWDIGGCRCIVRNNEDVYKLKSSIEKCPDLKIIKEYDYIKQQQPEGYRSLHLFISIKDHSEIIELQIRNQDDHNWATLVEITDLLFDTKLKEYGDDKVLLNFHFLLSKRNELEMAEKKEIAKVIRKYKFFDRLSAVFSRNYIQVRKQWVDIESMSNQKYFLIESSKNNIPKITSFKNFNDAETSYFNVYKSTQNANIVLTHLTTPNYKQISIAYSNYILTFHSFFDDCYKIFEELIEETLINRQYFRYIKYFGMYNSLVYNHLENLIKELQEIGRITEKKKKYSKLRLKEKEWISDIQNQVHKRQNNSKKLQVIYKKNMPHSFLGKRTFTFLTWAINYIHQFKFNRILDKYNKVNNN